MTRILVVDDNLSVRSAIHLLLRQQGWEVVLAADSSAGLLAFELSRFDIVMVDIFMPEVDGLETIKQLREITPDIPIVAMSGFRFRNSAINVPDFLGMAAELGATYCLRKPFAPQQLIAAINHCRESARPENENGTAMEDRP